jgi:hypothetical protein
MPVRSFVLTWRLETGDGAWLVKRLWPYNDEPWHDRLERIMELE